MLKKNYSEKYIGADGIRKKPLSKVTGGGSIGFTEKKLMTESDRSVLINELIEKRKDLFLKLNKMPIA